MTIPVRVRLLFTAVFVLVLAGTLLSRTDTDLEREARAIEAMLIAPCCFSQQVSVHQSEAAEKVRADVRARLAAGETRREILDAYLAMYGARVLATPPPEGINLLLYVTPVVALIASIGFFAFVVRRFSRRENPERAGQIATAPPATSALEARLDDELRDLD